MRLLSTSEVAERLGVPEATLRYWRYRGVGPKCGKLPGTARVIYRESDLIVWIDQAFEASA